MAKNKVKRVIIESAYARTEWQYTRIIFERTERTPPKFFHRPNKSKLSTIYDLCRDMIASGRASDGEFHIYPDGSFTVEYKINGVQS